MNELSGLYGYAVYQKALDLLLKMYEIIKKYPADER